MKNVKRISSILLIAIAMAGCDKVNDPLGESNNTPGPAPDDQVLRKVLLEEYTGHRCPNCPSATSLALQLQDNYGSDKMILVGLHVTGAFADPDPSDGYVLELRLSSDIENAYFSEFPAFALPKGLVNRTEYNNTSVLGSGDWSGAIAALINTPADVSLEFNDINYDTDTREVRAQIKIKALNQLTGDHHCTIYFVEDHIMGKQTDNMAPNGYIDPYDHRHVVRDVLNSPWGEVVFTGGAAASDSLVYVTPTYTVDPSWDIDNCSLVAYVYNATTKEILQVEEAYIIP